MYKIALHLQIVALELLCSISSFVGFEKRRGKVVSAFCLVLFLHFNCRF